MPVKYAYHTAVWLNELVYLGGGYEPDKCEWAYAWIPHN